MIDVFLRQEAEHKTVAEKAALSGDWKTLQREAESLVKIYGAILVSGLVETSSFPRWESLRAKWQEIERTAAERVKHASVRDGKASGDDSKQAVHADDGPSASADSGDAAAGKTRQTLRLADVKGLEDAKQVVMESLVNPVKHPDIYRTLKIKGGKGLLLYGPPGTGKTMFARAIAGELGLPFIYKKMSDLKDKYVGESEKNVSRLFEEAYQHKQCVVFLDECESLLRKRGNQKVNIVEAFLAELDGFDTRRDSQIFLLLATNRPWLIDSAVLRSGRIGAAAHVGLPDAETRRCIIESALRDVPLADDVNIDELVARTAGFSGAELNHGDGGGICHEARANASRRWIQRREGRTPGDPEWKRVEQVTRADFLEALKKVIPVSVKDPEIVKRNLEFSLDGKTASGGRDEDFDE